jgi:hypothetical protein
MSRSSAHRLEDELHDMALVRRHTDVRPLGCRCDEVYLAVFNVPNSLAGSDRTMKTARLPHAGVKVMEDIWVGLSDLGPFLWPLATEIPVATGCEGPAKRFGGQAMDLGAPPDQTFLQGLLSCARCCCRHR